MRIYEGSPRQDWEEVLRSVGAYLDDRGMRGLVFVETETGFIIQGTVIENSTGSAYSESMGKAVRKTIIVSDDEVGGFMDDAIARRGHIAEDPSPKQYEAQLRVIGRFMDEQKPRDIFFFEVDGSYVLRLSMFGQGGLRTDLVEFTRDDVADLIARAPALRRNVKAKDSPA
jgi:hypothetical protein